MLANELVIIGVRADPEPLNSALDVVAERPMVDADTD
jgi:hypothetical protein